MVETVRNPQDVTQFMNQLRNIEGAINQGNYEKFQLYSEPTLSSGRRVLKLDQNLEISLQTIEMIRKILDDVQLISSYAANSFLFGNCENASDIFRDSVKQHYLLFGGETITTGKGKIDDLIANKMIDMYRIVANELENFDVLNIQIRNPFTPPPLKGVIINYCQGSISNEETRNKLFGLRFRTELCLRELGSNPGAIQHIGNTFINRVESLERRLSQSY